MILKFHKAKITPYCFYSVHSNQDLKSLEVNTLLHKSFFKQIQDRSLEWASQTTTECKKLSPILFQFLLTLAGPMAVPQLVGYPLKNMHQQAA